MVVIDWGFVLVGLIINTSVDLGLTKLLQPANDFRLLADIFLMSCTVRVDLIERPAY